MNKKVIDGIRRYYRFSNEITDKQIAKGLKGSLVEVVVGIDIAKKNLVEAFGKAVPRILKKHFNREE